MPARLSTVWRACGSVARDDSVERVERIEQEVRIDLRLQRAQFGLRDQAAHFGGAKSFHLFDDHGGEPAERCQVFAQVAAPAVAAAQQQIADVGMSQAQRYDGFHPFVAGRVAKPGTSEAGTGNTEIAPVERGSQTVARKLLRRARRGRTSATWAVAQFRNSASPADREAWACISRILRSRSARRKTTLVSQRWTRPRSSANAISIDAEANQQQSFVQGVFGQSGVDHNPAQRHTDGDEHHETGHQCVRQEADEGVQQNEAIILQQDEERQRNAGVVEGQLPRPGFGRMSRSEMHERNGDQRRAHRAEDARRLGAAVPTAALESDFQHCDHGEDRKSDGDQQERSALEAGAGFDQFPQVHADRDRAQAVTRCDQRIEAVVQRQVQQHGREQAEHREAEEDHQAARRPDCRRGAMRTASEPTFHKNARLAAATESQLPRRRVPARSRSSRYRKMPKMIAPAVCPSVLTSRSS